MVHQNEGVFHIAVQDLLGDSPFLIVTETELDESPTIAPNGAMVMYATKWQNRSILAAVSLDAGIKYRLPAQTADVREPAWSPF
jgi:TolB protein